MRDFLAAFYIGGPSWWQIRLFRNLWPILLPQKPNLPLIARILELSVGRFAHRTVIGSSEDHRVHRVALQHNSCEEGLCSEMPTMQSPQVAQASAPSEVEDARLHC